MSFVQKSPELKALQEQIDKMNAEVASKFKDQAFREELSQEIAETIYKGFITENMVDLFTTVEYLPRNGRSTIEEVRGLTAYHMSRGGYIEASTLHSEVMEIQRDMVGFHVTESTDRLEENFGATADTLVTLGKAKLDAAVNQRVLAAYQAAVPSSSAYYSGASSVSLSQLNTAIAGVQDSTEAAELPTVVARPTMIRKIEDAITASNTYSFYTPQTNEDLLRRGVLGSYRGVNLISLKNHKDEFGNSYFPANELWVIGKDAGKTAFFGTGDQKNFIEDDNWYWHYLMRMEYGVAVVRPDRTRRIVDTSAAA